MNNIFGHIKYLFTTVAGLTLLIAALILNRILEDVGFTTFEAVLIDIPFLMIIERLIGLIQDYVKNKK